MLSAVYMDINKRTALSGQLFCVFIDFSAYRSAESEAYRKRLVNKPHRARVETAHFFFKPLLVYGANLFKQYNRILCKTAAVCVDRNMGWKICFVPLAGYRGGYNGWTVFVANIILDYKYGSDAALLRAYHRT